MDHRNIYSNEISKFKRFSECEDYNHCLREYLIHHFDWEKASVLEAGVGMGRFTDYYIDQAKTVTLTDSSTTMLDYCRMKYSRYEEKIDFVSCKHIDLLDYCKSRKYDIFISAYSLSYEAVKLQPEMLQGYLDSVLSLNVNSFVIIESIGLYHTNSNYLQQYKDYFNELSNRLNRIEITTDFHFQSVQEAEYYCGIFFGKEISERVKEIGSNIVPETTCLWYK